MSEDYHSHLRSPSPNPRYIRCVTPLGRNHDDDSIKDLHSKYSTSVDSSSDDYNDDIVTSTYDYTRNGRQNSAGSKTESNSSAKKNRNSTDDSKIKARCNCKRRSLEDRKNVLHSRNCNISLSSVDTPLNILEDYRTTSLSFAGCGFLGIYHVGAISCIKQLAPQLLKTRVAGASAGALAAALSFCDVDLGVITSSVLKTATEARSRALGPFSPTFNVEKLLREGLLSVLPENAHEIVSGRLFVSVTRLSDGKNILLSQFDTREDLIQALLMSCFIPLFSGMLPPIQNDQIIVDGGFSNNIPRLDKRTISVTPFAGNNDICPPMDLDYDNVDDDQAGKILRKLIGTQALVCSCFIPLFSGYLFPSFRNTKYLDGFFSDNVPHFEGFINVTVNPFAGHSDICPPTKSTSDIKVALLCSSFIPGFSGIQPLKIKGVRYIDGGFTDNLPELDSSTITVSPFCGEADVCPKDSTSGLITISLANTSIEISRENMQRFARILFPPSPETLNKMCQQGFNDALDFLQRNNLISCTRCIAVQSTVPLEADNDQRSNNMEAPLSDKCGQFGDIAERFGDVEYEEWEESCQNCDDCKSQRKEAMLDKLPDTVNKILQEAIDAANDEVEKWNNYSYASLLTLPMVYSVKIPYKMATGTANVFGVRRVLAMMAGKKDFNWEPQDYFSLTLGFVLVFLHIADFGPLFKNIDNYFGEKEVDIFGQGPLQRSIYIRRNESRPEWAKRLKHYGIIVIRNGDPEEEKEEPRSNDSLCTIC